MRSSTILAVMAVSGVALAATATGTAPCPAQNIVDACKKSTQVTIDACKATDYECLCNSYKAQATCYLNCPNDPAGASAKTSAQQWCSAADQAAAASPSTSSKPKPKSTSTSTSTSTGDGSIQEQTTTAGPQGTGGPVSLGGSNNNAGPTMHVVPVGGMLAAVAAIAALF